MSSIRPALLCLGIGLALADSSIVTLALPSILGRFDVGITTVAWVLTSFNLALLLAAVPAAYVARRRPNEAFALGAPRIVLNTCTLDAPQALPNYLARGFTIVSEDQYLLDVPAKIGQALPTAMTRDTAPT